ncbi:MAG: hypothetical protein M2R45_05338 [Verrucomicrobia subdivision 3 bacterium]|nr:hypothetical protein [Limisphaerales bacterium]MCS1417833.1 hypothetical protein [Limisphaerales bacterium]
MVCRHRPAAQRQEKPVKLLKPLNPNCVFICGSLVSQSLQAQHGYLEAGAIPSQASSSLVFANSSDFAAEHGFIQPLVWASDGPYASYSHGNITVTGRAVAQSSRVGR